MLKSARSARSSGKLDALELESVLRQAAPGARVSLQAVDRRAVARDMWPRRLIELSETEAPAGPSAVVWPETLEQVVGVVRAAREHGFPLVPFGAGSGVCGGVSPSAHQVVVDLKRIRDHHIAHGPELDVGAGALGITLEEDLLRAGYTTGHYPSSILCSTVGGWVAGRGAGQCSGRYGKIEDMVTWVELVLGTGEPVTFRRRELGPNLLPLIVGSEGCLGIITRVGLRLHPAPTTRAYLAFSFEDVEAGIHALRAIFQAGLRPAVARLYDPLDTLSMKREDKPSSLAEPPQPTSRVRNAVLRGLLQQSQKVARAMNAVESTLYSRAGMVLIVEGPDAHDVQQQAQALDSVCRARGGSALGEGPARAWYRHRYHVSYRQPPLFRSGAFVDTMEVAAMWSRLPAVYSEVRRALAPHALVMAHFSHSYPDGGSIYFTFAGCGDTQTEALAIYDRAWRAALSAAIGAGASLSHHHGVGRSKAPRLPEELGSALTLARAVKSAWDPDNILNPGALLPAPSEQERIDPPAAPTEPLLDGESALVELPAAWRLGDAEAWLNARQRTLGLDPEVLVRCSALSVDAWVASGLPGLPDSYADPVGSRYAGFSARLTSGRRIRQHGAPRRAVGPDLASLFVGTDGAFGTVEALLVPAPELNAAAPPSLAHEGERNPPVSEAEAGALAAIRRAL